MTTLQWDAADATWTPLEREPAGELLAADSFVVEEGHVRGFAHHADRFAAACSEVGGPVAEAHAAWGALRGALPASGRWFPRVELARVAEGERLRLLLRSAPAPTSRMRVWVSTADPRRCPRRKGPDLQALGELRARARKHGADEALIRDAAGHPIEGAYTSLLWWEGETLVAVPDEAPILAGVTRRMLLDLARERGVPTSARLRRADELAQREVWLTSATVGIAVVERWLPGPTTAPRDEARLGEWRELLAARGEPVADAAQRRYG